MLDADLILLQYSIYRIPTNTAFLPSFPPSFLPPSTPSLPEHGPMGKHRARNRGRQKIPLPLPSPV